MESPTFPPNGPHFYPWGRQPAPDSDNTPFLDSFQESSEYDASFEVMDVLLKQLFQPAPAKSPPAAPNLRPAVSQKTEILNISSLKSGQRFGPFLIHNYIGHGGFGVVFRANDTRVNQQVALKVPRSDRTTDQKTIRRFEHEARILARVEHPSIISVWNVGVIDNMPYMTSDYHPGETLASWILNHPGGLGVRIAVNWARHLASALGCLHENAIVHRDLKPSNILISEIQFQVSAHPTKSPLFLPKLIDFGLGAQLNQNLDADPNNQCCIGTPAYMSPENAMSAIVPVDIRSDIYALGLIIAEMITGRRISRFHSVGELLVNICENSPINDLHLYKHLFPEPIMAILEKCLALKPEQRYQSPSELLTDLEKVSSHHH